MNDIIEMIEELKFYNRKVLDAEPQVELDYATLDVSQGDVRVGIKSK